MKHLKNAENLQALKKKDFRFKRVIKSDTGRLEEFFQKSPFVRILDAVLDQLYHIPQKDMIKADLYNRFGLKFGPADLLPYLHTKLSYMQKKIAIDIASISALTFLIQVCNTALNTLNFDGHSIDDMSKLVIENISQLDGITPNTVMMMKLYTLSDLDICPINDYRLNDAVRYLYGGKTVAEVSDKWAPYRSIATWYIWEYQRRRMIKKCTY
jgi:DNA-3-methyladenine glycosylase II